MRPSPAGGPRPDTRNSAYVVYSSPSRTPAGSPRSRTVRGAAGDQDVKEKRKLDAVSALVLGGLAVSFLLVALGGSERVLLLRDSLIASILGLAVAVSAAFPKPVMYYLVRQVHGVEPNLRAMRVLSLVLGLGLVVEMAVRTAMVLAMTTDRFLLVSPFVQYGMTGALVAWGVFYMRRRG